MFKKHLVPIVIGLIILVVLIISITKWADLTNFFRQIVISKTATTCQSDWKTYTNNILGVSFCYPPSWGEPKTEPIENLTKLEGAVDDFSKNEHNSYAHSISISFSNLSNSNILMRFFNEQYGGEYYPNGLAYSAGYIDNISKLKATKNICNYKIDFHKSWEYNGTMEEVWQNCFFGTKIVLIENVSNFGGPDTYSYQLNGYAYKKLQNGYFDNLLIKFPFEYLSQNTKRTASLKQFFQELKNLNTSKTDKKYITEEQFNQKRADFETFVRSIKVFKPVMQKQKSFAPIAGENNAITTIRQYYYYLTSGQLSNAYAMYVNPKISLEKFQEQYKNILKSEPRDFVKKGDHEYEFYVDYQENNTAPTVYHVVMNASGDKVETVSSEEITSPIIKSGPYTAFAKRVNNKNYMVLTENGQETIVDEGETFDENDSNIRVSKYFSNPEFSSDNHYLFYVMSGWEWSNGNVYDIQNKKRIVATNESSADHGFTDNGKYFFSCSSPGMSGGEGAVWSLSDGKVVYDIAKDSANYMNIDCQYKKSDNFISFSLSGYYAQKDQVAQPDKTVKFSF